MPKRKAGEWFEVNGNPALLTSATPDEGGDSFKFVAFTRIGTQIGKFNDWARDDEIGKPLRRQRWLAFKREARPSFGNAYPHEFVGFYSPDGRRHVIAAGCRAFTITQAVEHWINRKPRWLRSDMNAELNEWSLRYVARFAAKLRQVRADA